MDNDLLNIGNLDCYFDDKQNEWLSAGVASLQGLRLNQEDAHLIDINFDQDNELALFGVFDGHNGPEVALYAVQLLPELIKNNEFYQNKDYPKALKEAFLNFDQLLKDKQKNDDLMAIRNEYESNNGPIKNIVNVKLLSYTVGSTAVVALLSRKTGQVFVANLGDSRCTICTNRKIYRMTKDHKPTDKNESKRINNAGYEVIDGRISSNLIRINISRTFGDIYLKNISDLCSQEQALIALPDITIFEKQIQSSDFLILTTDGISNIMRTKQLCLNVHKYLQNNVQLSKICRRIIKICSSSRFGQDNMTCLIIKFEENLLAHSKVGKLKKKFSFFFKSTC